jgi:hypothetical protein
MVQYYAGFFYVGRIVCILMKTNSFVVLVFLLFLPFSAFPISYIATTILGLKENKLELRKIAKHDKIYDDPCGQES